MDRGSKSHYLTDLVDNRDSRTVPLVNIYLNTPLYISHSLVILIFLTSSLITACDVAREWFHCYLIRRFFFFDVDKTERRWYRRATYILDLPAWNHIL